MFDIEKEEQAIEQKANAQVDWEAADWEDITDAHATEEESSGRADARQNAEQVADRIYRKVHQKHKERTTIAAARYAALAIGITAVAYLCRSAPKLSIALGVVALIFGLIAAYGAGKCREMDR